MIRRDVAVLNRSTVMTDDEVQKITAALQRQVTEHYAPLWGVDARLTFLPKSKTTGWERKWNLVVLDTSDEANALGYHDLTPDDLPLGKAFAKTTQMYHHAVSGTMSHELLEMLGDPGINLVATVYLQNGGLRLYAYENCDAVEAGGYEIDGVQVSNFCTPFWFMPHTQGKAVQFDYLRKCTAPLQLLKGGYLQYLDWGNAKGWQQVFADKLDATPETRPKVGSRRERRRTPMEFWTPSPA